MGIYDNEEHLLDLRTKCEAIFQSNDTWREHVNEAVDLHTAAAIVAAQSPPSMGRLYIATDVCMSSYVALRSGDLHTEGETGAGVPIVKLLEFCEYRLASGDRLSPRFFDALHTRPVQVPLPKLQRRIVEALRDEPAKLEELEGRLQDAGGRPVQRTIFNHVTQLRERGIVQHKMGVGYYLTKSEPNLQ